VRLATAGERTDERCLADNIYFEAAHEPLDGKLAVAR
jgi:spore germination cell wall hydrolase CwlJ-like protein